MWLGHHFQGQKVKGQLAGAGILWRPPAQLVSSVNYGLVLINWSEENAAPINSARILQAIYLSHIRGFPAILNPNPRVPAGFSPAPTSCSLQASSVKSLYDVLLQYSFGIVLFFFDSRDPVSEMTYTVSSGTLNSTIPYHLTRELIFWFQYGRFLTWAKHIFICHLHLLLGRFSPECVPATYVAFEDVSCLSGVILRPKRASARYWREVGNANVPRDSKTGHLTVADNFGQMLTDSQTSFTIGLNNTFATKLS